MRTVEWSAAAVQIEKFQCGCLGIWTQGVPCCGSGSTLLGRCLVQGETLELHTCFQWRRIELPVTLEIEMQCVVVRASEASAIDCLLWSLAVRVHCLTSGRFLEVVSERWY